MIFYWFCNVFCRSSHSCSWPSPSLSWHDIQFSIGFIRFPSSPCSPVMSSHHTIRRSQHTQVGELVFHWFTMIPLLKRMFHKEGSQQLDIPSECSIVRKACFPKVLQGFWVHRVGGFFSGQAILAGILCFTNGFAVFLGRVFFWPGEVGKPSQS